MCNLINLRGLLYFTILLLITTSCEEDIIPEGVGSFRYDGTSYELHYGYLEGLPNSRDTIPKRLYNFTLVSNGITCTLTRNKGFGNLITFRISKPMQGDDFLGDFTVWGPVNYNGAVIQGDNPHGGYDVGFGTGNGTITKRENQYTIDFRFNKSLNSEIIGSWTGELIKLNWLNDNLLFINARIEIHLLTSQNLWESFWTDIGHWK